MKLNPRTLPVQRAEVELQGWLIDWAERHDLTYVEALRCVLQAAERYSKYLLRDERHSGDSDARADEE